MKKLSYFRNKFDSGKKLYLEREVNEFSVIYAGDVVRSIEKVAGNKKCFNKTINVADCRTYDYDELLNEILGDNYSRNNVVFESAQEIWENGRAVPFVWGPPLNVSLSEKIIGLENYTSLREWVPRTLEWEINND